MTVAAPLLGGVFEASYPKKAKISKASDYTGLLPKVLICENNTHETPTLNLFTRINVLINVILKLHNIMTRVGQL